MNNNRSGPTPRTKIKISHKNAPILLQRVRQFQKLLQEQQSQFQTSSLTTYYIISAVYLKQWEQFCASNSQQRYLPIPMNEDIVELQTQKLKQGLSEHQHFQIVSEKIYKIVRLENCQGITLKRNAYFQGTQKKVPLYLSSFQYMKILYSDIKDIDYKRKRSDDFKLSSLNLSSQSTIEDFIKQIKQKQNIHPYKNVRLWKAPANQSIQSIVSYIRKKCQYLNTPYCLPGIGKLIQSKNQQTKQELKLSSLELQEKQFFIVEVSEEKGKWFFRTDNEEKCENCYQYKVLKIICGCKKVGYCCEQCQQKDKYYHQRRCTYAEQEELNRKVQMVLTQKSSKGLVGLSNLGNTCFMNSCLQCLSNTIPLTWYFLKSYYQQQINKDNVLGTQGKLAKTYAKFIKAMWCDSSRTYSPSSLKYVVATINPMFSGYAQHDSQEFFSFLIDGLHEDLSRVPKKPYVQSIQSNNRPDKEVAQQSWIAHTMRNQSIVTDLMTGQYKSRVVCPDCKKQSITFDPFVTVSLPIPEDTSGYLKFFMISNNNEKKARQYQLCYKKADPQQWFYEAVKHVKREPNQFVFCILSVHQNVYDFFESPKAEIINKVQEGKLAFLLELGPDQRNLQKPINIVVRYCTPRMRDYQNLWFKRPFFFEKKNCTGKHIYEKLAKYIFAIYTKKKNSGFFSSSISQEEYIKKITKQKIFTLVLKYKKTVQRLYSRVETSFEKQIKIQDQTFVPDILDKLKYGDYELDVRFSKESAKDFQFDRLRDFDDKTDKQKKKASKSKQTASIQECFQHFQEKQVLDVGNQWYCSNCKDHKLATKQMFIYKAPEILILHLKRFKNKGGWRKQKNQTNVIFPQELDITKHVIDKTPMCTYREWMKKKKHYHDPIYKVKESPSSGPIYQLYAVSNHYGGLGGGHYTAYAKNNNKWYQYDDTYVKSVHQDDIKGSGAYMLFYRRKNGLQIQ